MRKLNTFSVILTGFLILFLFACSPADQPPVSGVEGTEPPVQEKPTGEDIKSIDRLIEDFEKKGLKVEITQSIEQPFFTVQGILLSLNGENIQVFQYPDEESREKDSHLISSDGSVIGNNQIEWITPPYIWASGDLIVIYPGTDESVIDAINDTFGEPIARGHSMPDANKTPTELPPAVFAAIQDLALRLGISEDEIEVLSYEEVTWSDSCLGLGRPEEACLQVITPGYLIRLRAINEDFEYHSDQSGRNLRLAEGAEIIGGKPGLDLDKPVSIIAAMRFLSNFIDVPVSDIALKSAEKVDWPNSCLGLPDEGELCAEVIVPGWRIILQAGTKTFEIHTDLTGQTIRLKS